MQLQLAAFYAVAVCAAAVPQPNPMLMGPLELAVNNSALFKEATFAWDGQDSDGAWLIAGKFADTTNPIFTAVSFANFTIDEGLAASVVGALGDYNAVLSETFPELLAKEDKIEFQVHTTIMGSIYSLDRDLKRLHDALDRNAPGSVESIDAVFADLDATVDVISVWEGYNPPSKN